ncbi:MAG TPA: GDSL-type esterase/lipase family protein [Solirubrobacteraceae bacterium]
MRRSRPGRIALAVVAASACSALGASSALASTPPLPNSMASSGDSITRAYDSTASGCFLSDCPQYSWSTGYNSTVNSQYQRILVANQGISGHEYNDAQTGAKMSALDGQLKTAAGQGVQYATVLMGANDVCTSSISTMTPTSTLQGEFQTALSDFFTADPNASVFVSSIPNVYQLWQLLHNNSSAESTWTTFGICQSMLSPYNTDAQRQAVLTQEENDNSAEQAVCASFAHCRWDNLATFDYSFTTKDISTVDYFHPSLTGQNALANVTWGASYWPSTK